MTTHIYLIRHGEVHNPKQILYGRLPRFGLSEKGKKQIEKTAEFLKGKNVSAIYSSPLLRARQTAGIISKNLNIPKINLLKGIHEIKTSLEGQPAKNWDLTAVDYYAPPILKKADETIDRIAERMNKSIENLLKQNEGKSVVVVSHGDPIMILRISINGQPMKISSLRQGAYATHGEVIVVQKIDDKNLTVKSIFIPKV